MSEPPKKKRKSKWGVKPEDIESANASAGVSNPSANNDDPPVDVQGPKGAEAAAAKLNAMLAAQGKLVKSDPPACKPVLPSSQSQTSATPLFSSLGSAVSGMGLLSTPKLPTLPLPVLVKPASSTTSSGPYYVQDKIFVGLAKAPSSFNLKERLEGPEGSFLAHISKQTGAKVFLRGRGSGYIEPTSKTESFEALHIYISHPNKQGLESAQQLCDSLIETVKKDYDTFMATQQVTAPLGFGGTATSQAAPPRMPYVNPYQYPPVPPLVQGYGPVPSGPPGYPIPPPPHPPYHGQPPPPPVPMAGGYSPYPPPHPPHHQPSYPYPPPPLNPPGGPMPPPQGYCGAPPPSQYPPPHPITPIPPIPPVPPQPEALEAPDLFATFKPHDKVPQPVKRKFTEVVEAKTAHESSEAGVKEMPSHLNTTGTSDAASTSQRHHRRGLSNGERPSKPDDDLDRSDSLPARQPDSEKVVTSLKKESAPASKDFDFKVPSLPPMRLSNTVSSVPVKTSSQSSIPSTSSPSSNMSSAGSERPSVEVAKATGKSTDTDAKSLPLSSEVPASASESGDDSKKLPPLSSPDYNGSTSVPVPAGTESSARSVPAQSALSLVSYTSDSDDDSIA